MVAPHFLFQEGTVECFVLLFKGYIIFNDILLEYCEGFLLFINKYNISLIFSHRSLVDIDEMYLLLSTALADIDLILNIESDDKGTLSPKVLLELLPPCGRIQTIKVNFTNFVYLFRYNMIKSREDK